MSEKRVKLTKAQWDVMIELSGRPEGRCFAETYSPIKKLAELGFVLLKEERFSDRFTLTDAGKKFLSEESAA